MKAYLKFEIPRVAVFYGAMSGIAAIWIYFSNFKFTFFGTKGMVLATLIAFTLFVLSNECSDKTKWGQKLTHLFKDMLTPLPTGTILLLAVFSAVGEELLFRGAIQNQFGLVIASVLFGLMHFPVMPVMIPWTITAMLMGFVLGGLYMYSGNILAPILLHFLINFLNIWAMNQKHGFDWTK